MGFSVFCCMYIYCPRYEERCILRAQTFWFRHHGTALRSNSSMMFYLIDVKWYKMIQVDQRCMKSIRMRVFDSTVFSWLSTAGKGKGRAVPNTNFRCTMACVNNSGPMFGDFFCVIFDHLSISWQLVNLINMIPGFHAIVCVELCTVMFLTIWPLPFQKTSDCWRFLM